jgi:hypothetical protein
MTGTARIFALLIAVIAWVGLAVQFAALYSESGSAVTALGTMIVYFTITTNLVVAVFFTGITAGLRRFDESWLVAGAALSILLVGIVYHLLLRGLRELSGGSAVANVLLHQVTPVLVPVFWLLFVAKGRLKRVDPWIWAIYPLAYVVYALVWGGVHGGYPYPFLNVERLGWGRVGVNAAVIAAGFLVVAWGLVALDRWLGRSSEELERCSLQD